MSSLYGMVFGRVDGARSLVWLAGFTRLDHVGRFRDAWLERHEDGEPRIAIYTRNGGGNRADCWCIGWAGEGQDEGELGCACAGTGGPACRCPACVANYRMPEMPNHLFGRDDDFDSTYRTEYLRPRAGLPDDLVAALREAATDPVDTDERWAKAIEAIGGKA